MSPSALEPPPAASPPSRRSPPPDVIEAATARFGGRAEGLAPLGGFLNTVYAWDAPFGPGVLRFTPGPHRTAAQVRAELHWVAYLNAAGLDVAAPRPSASGAFVETVVAADGAAFHVAAFDRAPGAPPAPHERTPEVVRAWGAALGRLRALTRGYVPADPAGREEWTREPLLRDRRREGLVAPDVQGRWNAVVARLEAAPRTAANFGLVHGDAHAGNLHVARGADGAPRVVLFDFDDAAHHFHAQDVAVTLYHETWRVADDRERAARARDLLAGLLDGHREHAPFGAADLALLPDLLNLRDLTMHAVFRRFVDAATLDADGRALDAELARRARSDAPFVDLDFSAFS